MSGHKAMTSAELRDTLKQLGLSQMALARLVCVPGSTVRRWVCGQHRIPRSVELLLTIMLDAPSVRRRMRKLASELRGQ